ncbi:DoxX family protein [Streptomyces sp. NPDC091371]|uniref:DoxX family protein n=1 Tax=Streptomyces sp. NPDC091371 TaxID=3155303 RepID=UPI00343D0C1E
MEAVVFVAYLVVTLVTSVVNGLAAIANFVGHDYPKSQADKLGVPRSWMRPLGVLLGAGALGLLVGIEVPVVGGLAAGGLILYFLGALYVHLRVGDYQLSGWAVFFCLPVGSLAFGLVGGAW